VTNRRARSNEVSPATTGYGGFGPENLPYGVGSDGHVVVAYGGSAIDLAALLRGDPNRDGAIVPLGHGVFIDPGIFVSGSLNTFMALGPLVWTAVRRWVAGRLNEPPGPAWRSLDDVELVLPFEVSDYVDFYSCEAHVMAMGRLLRPGEAPLPPAWRHIPLGYHGRSSTVLVSGEEVPRPTGIVDGGQAGPEYRPTRRLDVEVELGFVVGAGNERGQPVPAASAGEHIFGVVLVNDWSARDIQAFEYRPLGPFLGKSFATSISPWVIPLEALKPWLIPGPVQVPQPAPYLRAPEPRGLDVNLELLVNGQVLSAPSSAELYWSMAQQLAHLTVNGAATRPGDLFATGTISGSGPRTAGSLMELTSGGHQPIVLGDTTQRTWLEDGDEVVVRGWCGSPDTTGWLSLGEVRGRVLPAGSPAARVGRAPGTRKEVVPL
jgi:fumarylacetoacetase